MINVGGWLLLSILLAWPLLLVQRSEASRRLITLVVMAFVAALTSAYGLYRMGGECTQWIPSLCELATFRARASVIAYNTTNLAALTAIILNVLFWLLIGRYNPPGSSDAIRVLGLND